MPLAPDGPAPYAPVATIMEVVNRYRDRGLQTPFDADVLTRAGVTESLAPRTLLSLRHLDLIDEQGNPTPLFEGLRRAPSDEFPTRLEEVVRAVYADVFQFADPTVDAPERVADAFRQYVPAGQRSRMVTLFLGLCERAGIIPEAPARQRTTRASRPASATTPRRSSSKVAVRGQGVRKRQDEALPPTGTIFGVTEKDIALLNETEFAEVWDALGKVARARARGSAPAEADGADDEEGGAE
jgi:Family of unknown function (DUF5343)